METFLRAALVYIALLVVFRLAGRRVLAQLTNFDLILMLIISESVQNGLVGNDFSLTNALILVLTLITMDIVFSLLKLRQPLIEKMVDGLPFVLVDHGKPLEDRLKNSRVDEDDIMEAARNKMGLERMEQIKYAVLEKSGEISIIPEPAKR